MASKAVEWAKRLKEAQTATRCVERNAPTAFCLHLDSRLRLDLSVGTDGLPNVSTASENYRPDAARLIEMAKWILATFGDQAGA